MKANAPRDALHREDKDVSSASRSESGPSVRAGFRIRRRGESHRYHGNPLDDEFAMVVLVHSPNRALPLVRRALRSKTPLAVQKIAALLALSDRPWCHREIESALRDP